MSYLPDITGEVPDLLNFPLMISIDNGESWVSPAVIEYGQGFLIGFGLQNAGETKAENVAMEIRVNGEVLKEKTFAQVKAGKSYMYNYGPFYWEPGEYTIDLIYDPDNLIVETNENNNVFSYTVRVEDNDVFFPDLAPSTPAIYTQPVMLQPVGEENWIAPEIVETGIGFKIGFGVKNNGTVKAENVPVQIRINDVIVVDKTIAAMPRGANRRYQFGTFGFDPGTYSISLVVDPYNEIQEDNENNNVFTYTFTVPGNQDWLIKQKWTSFQNLFGTKILLNEYAPIDPDTGEKCGAGCGNVARSQILSYFASIGYGFTIELTEEDAFLFDGKIAIDGTEKNAKANGTISFAEVNKLLEDFDKTSAEDVAALCYASAVIMANEATYENVYKRLGFKYSKMERRGKSDFWTEDGNLSDKAWEMLIRNVKNGQPVTTGVPDPHVIIIDGYDAKTDMVHINFDFGIANGKRYVEKYGVMRGNGWYSREECNALDLQYFHYDITPDTEKPGAGKVDCQIHGTRAELSLDFTDDVGVWKKYYQIAGEDEWREFTDKVTITKNTTVFFKACDKGKNYSDIISYAVTTLEAPPTLTITGNPQNWTNKDVVLTATADRGTIEFFNGNSWIVSTELIVTTNGTYRFRVTDAGGVVTEKSVTVDKIDKVAPLKPTASADITAATIQNVTVTAAFSNDSIVKEYSLDNKSWQSYTAGVVMSANGTVYFRGIDAAGNISKTTQYNVNNIVAAVPQNLNGTAKALNWDEHPLAERYVVDISKNDYSNILQLETENNGLDLLGLNGNYQWQIRLSDQQESAKGNDISGSGSAAPQILSSNADGNMDLFFGNASGVWELGYVAEHQGVFKTWNGTNEQVMLAGKNKISDIFIGTDANILVLTDDANGDALFVDDIYTALGDQARLKLIDEIRAGAGDDIIDMTSQSFEYTGDVTWIYGGLGNDTIWANNCPNILFGDAGNDRLVGGSDNDVFVGGIGNDSMHGGGGNDIFCFGGEWSVDTVEQLAGGSVTLWFEEGSESNWNVSTLTYTDGANSVTVSGVTAVTLKFGDEPPVAGAFLDAASEKIFEDKNKGMLA